MVGSAQRAVAPRLFVVACLIVINGPPGCGKSTLARMYAAEHALALVLDVDVIRGSLGRWREDLRSAGLAARAIAVAAARAHLAAGHDVVVPQFLRRPGFLAELERVTRDAGAGFAEIVLLGSKDDAHRAYAARASSAGATDRAAHDLAGHVGGTAELEAMHDQLVAFLATRPAARVIPFIRGQPARAYAAMLAALPGRPGPEPGNDAR